MKKLTFKKYQELIETQSRKLLDGMASVAAGNLDVKFEVSEGIAALTDLAMGLNFMIEELSELTAEPQPGRAELEQRLDERNWELEQALKDLQTVQRRYVQAEWAALSNVSGQGYLLDDEQDGPTHQAWLPVMTPAVQRAETVTATPTADETDLAVPISLHGELVGVLGFARVGEQSWTEQEITIVEEIAGQVGLALEAQRLSDQTRNALNMSEQQAKRLAQLSEMSRQLNLIKSLDDIYRIAAEQATNIIEADRTSITLLNEAGDHFTVLALRGEAGAIPVGVELPVAGSNPETVI